MKTERVVIDTNVLISAALLEDSVPARARNHALRHGQLIATEHTLAEFVGRLMSPRFDAYTSRAARETLLQRLIPVVEMASVVQIVKACRDPNDDKILEAAVNGRADVIITGDRDLLTLHPYAGVDIRSPAAYLDRVPQNG
jgi:putative PIN family toxin of toxin-antitoxin system